MRKVLQYFGRSTGVLWAEYWSTSGRVLEYFGQRTLHLSYIHESYKITLWNRNPVDKYITKKGDQNDHLFILSAEREGFEPPVPLSTAVFKTAVIDHSTTFPNFFKKALFFESDAKVRLFFELANFSAIFFAK